ncbi:MAG: hypothetical protein [Bacteriophage sp.]|nr:MAG: hypothetical protein [Bacteriophage sp.]
MKTKSLVAFLAFIAACLAALFFCPPTFAEDAEAIDYRVTVSVVDYSPAETK